MIRRKYYFQKYITFLVQITKELDNGKKNYV